LPVCANPRCSSGWLRLWRARRVPVFEGGWLCGPVCTRAVLRTAVTRERKGGDGGDAVVHRHRVPLGLVLLAQGAVTREQLRSALVRQRRSGGRVGAWLEREHGIAERVVTRALGAQWGCPVLTLDNHSPERSAAFAPRLLLDAFGFLPLRRAGAELLYVAFEDRIDRCVSFAVERMTGLRVEAGLLGSRDFDAAHRRLLGAVFPPARLIEAAGVDALVGALAGAVEDARPAEARLVRMHEYYWLRMWRAAPGSTAGDAVEDVLCSLAEARA
jgi:hypothetical protein